MMMSYLLKVNEFKRLLLSRRAQLRLAGILPLEGLLISLQNGIAHVGMMAKDVVSTLYVKLPPQSSDSNLIRRMRFRRRLHNLQSGTILRAFHDPLAGNDLMIVNLVWHADPFGKGNASIVKCSRDALLAICSACELERL